MEKYVVLGDTHLGLYNDSEIWHNVVKNLFNEISDFCIRNNIKTIIHGGDFFHNRKNINVKTIQSSIEIIKTLKDLNLIIIIGNHDTYFKNTINPTSLQIFQKYNNVKIIDKPTKFDDILLVPWMGDHTSIKAKYCFGHFEINGFHMNSNYVCKKGIKYSQFKEFKQVLSSHFHTPSKKGNIQYLGSPFQQTFQDVNSKRGYYVWDNGDLKFIEFTNYPKFYKINASEKIKSKIIKNNIIKLEFKKDYGTNKNEQIVNECLQYNPLNLKVDFSEIALNEVEIDEKETLSLMDHNKIINKYINKFDLPDNIKKKTLISIISSLSSKILAS